MGNVLLLGAELTHKTLWNPTILGVLVVLSGIVLFCGSTYLLVATNIGARTGFLVAASCLTGLLVLLSTLWLTTFTPVESPKGRSASWKPVEVVDDVSGSSIPVVRDAPTEGRVVRPEDAGNIRPGVEAALVKPAAGSTESAPPSEFATFTNAPDVITTGEGLTTWEVGGGTKLVFWHHPLFAVVQFCADDNTDDTVPFGEVPPDPKCAPSSTQVLVLERDLGSLRQPAAFYLATALVLFGLSLLSLHWRERDLQRAAQAAAST